MDFKDDKELNKYTLDFMKENNGFIHLCILKACPNISDYEDLKQEAFIIIRDSLKKYNKEKGVKPLTYVGRCLKFKLHNIGHEYYFIRLPQYVFEHASKFLKDSSGKYKGYEKYYKIIRNLKKTSIDSDKYITDSIVTYEDELESNIKRDKYMDYKAFASFINRITVRFPQNEKYLIDKMFEYGDDIDYVKIEKELGLPYKYIYKVKNRAMKRLKSRIENYYNVNIGDLLYD